MTRKDKSLEKLKDYRQDKNWTYDEVETMLVRLGFKLRNVVGSHHQYSNGLRIFTVAIHGKKARVETIKEIRRFLSGK